MTMTLAKPEETKSSIVQRRVVEDDGPLAFMMDTARFEHMHRISQAMSHSVFLPEHLRGVRRGQNFEAYPAQTIAANCFRVLNQAMRWGVDPYAVADETYVVGGKLGYQGKLVIAIVNARAGLEEPLNYVFEGAGDNRKITIFGRFKGSSTDRTVEVTVGQAKTENQMWRKDPDQKLVYTGAIKWARRHCPEIIMGVLTDDDLDAIEARRERAAQQPSSSLNDRLKDVTTQGVARVAMEEPPALLTVPETIPATDGADIVTNDDPDHETNHDAEPPEPEIPDSDVGTIEAFGKALLAIGATNGVDAEIADKVLGKLRVGGLKIGASRPSDAMKARRDVLTAAIAGKLDWSAGKIVE